MGDNLFTIKEIAQRLDMPESTLRKYRDTYMEYIPYIGSGRNKKYEEEAVEVFRMIRESREERRLSWEDTEEQLRDRYSLNEQTVRAKKRAVIKADDAVDLVDRLEDIMKQLKGGGEKQDFMMTALANELMRFSGTLDKVKGMEKNIEEFRRLIYSYNEVVQKQQKQGARRSESIEKKLGTIEEALVYLPRYIDAKFEELAKTMETVAVEKEPDDDLMIPEPELPKQEEPGIKPEELHKLREEVLSSRIELGKFKGLYEKTKKDFGEYKEKQALKIDEQLSEPVAERLAKMKKPILGGKLTVRRRKN